MVIYVQKWAKTIRKCVTLLSFINFVYVSEFGTNRAKPHMGGFQKNAFYIFRHLLKSIGLASNLQCSNYELPFD